MNNLVGKVIDLDNLPTALPTGSYSRLSTDSYGRLHTTSQTASLTDGSQKTQIIDSDGNSIDSYNVSTGIYALKLQEVLIPGSEDNTNNVTHTNCKPLANSTNALSFYQTTSLVTNGVIKNTAGKLFKISGILKPSDNSGSTHFIQLFNATSVPADTTVPKFLRPITAATNTTEIFFEYEFAINYGMYFDTGICFAISSTLASKTLTTIATAWLQVSYI